MATALTQRQPVEESTGHRPRTRRRARVVLTAVLVLALLGWVAAVAMPHGTKTTSERAAGEKPSTASPVLTDDVTWLAVAGMPVPVSRSDGPRCLTSTTAACFSRSPRGAAFAAVHLVVRCFPFVGPAIYERTVSGQVVGVHRTALLRLTRQAYEVAAAGGGVVGGGALEIPASDAVAGYQLAGVDDPAMPSSVVVGLLVRQTEDGGVPSFTRFTVHLQWLDGDWRLEAPEWGDWRTVASPAYPQDGAFTPYDDGGGPR